MTPSRASSTLLLCIVIIALNIPSFSTFPWGLGDASPAGDGFFMPIFWLSEPVTHSRGVSTVSDHR